MRNKIIPTAFAAPSWSTSSFGDATGTSPMELAALSDHLSLCQGANGRLTYLQYAGEILHRFVATRFVTTLALATLVIGAGLLAL
ncbi:hypothetical protein SAMN05216303_104382 [Rhodoferax sp. OV413]|uniref:hypothetical protein n=1 Tax=Rhodoferax sp. OV413 TaxID=1855285 RepID=UPI000890ED65|nr:hypothetical protein [Rhodoferax sp. OV413]SDP46958.1 hypothetical protein SAMN05216303_104382 [Rhodoferax sp. OV413]